MNKHPLITGYLILACMAAGVYFFNPTKALHAQIFSGHLEEIKNNSLVVEGQYIDQAGKRIGKSGKVEILIDEAISIKSIALLYPTDEELKVSGGWYNLADLKKEERDTDFQNLKQQAIDIDMDVTAFAQVDVFGDKKFRATKIEYYYLMYNFDQ